MSEFESRKVSVLFYYDGEEQYAHPVRLFWNSREYTLGVVQFWYTEKQGCHHVHHYTVSDADGDFTFQLRLETENLTWTLESVVMADNELPEASRIRFVPFLGATV